MDRQRPTVSISTFFVDSDPFPYGYGYSRKDCTHQAMPTWCVVTKRGGGEWIGTQVHLWHQSYCTGCK